MLIDAQKVDQVIGWDIALVVSPRQGIGNIVVAEKYQFVDREGDFGPGCRVGLVRGFDNQ